MGEVGYGDPRCRRCGSDELAPLSVRGGCQEKPALMVLPPPEGVRAAFGLSFSISDPKALMSAASTDTCGNRLCAIPSLCHQTTFAFSDAGLSGLLPLGVLSPCLLCWPTLMAEAASCIACIATSTFLKLCRGQNHGRLMKMLHVGLPLTQWITAPGMWLHLECQSHRPMCELNNSSQRTPVPLWPFCITQHVSMTLHVVS